MNLNTHREIRVCGDFAYIPLTKGYEAIIDADKADSARKFNWYAEVKTRKDGSVSNVYAAVRVDGVKVWLHRFILQPPFGKVIDHIDGNGLLNTLSNLRPVYHAQNVRNSPIRISNTSGAKGVSFHKDTGRWHASIGFECKRHYLGLFDTKEAAACAYAEASKRLHGEFGRIA